jgi:DNA-binding NarL/FixJ family response regulator
MNGNIEMAGRDREISPVVIDALSEREFCPTRVWLIDDNANFRTLLASLLGEQGGFDCERQFSNPADALEALGREARPDIILLDIEMGEHNGLDAIRPIKSLAPDTHVLMLTTFAAPRCRERAFREGASDFMLKSWLPSEIAAHMRKALEFGDVAGLLAAYLGGGRPLAAQTIVEPKAAREGRQLTIAERWMTYLRGLLKFSPS